MAGERLTRSVALAVVQATIEAGEAQAPAGADVATEIDAAMWWPDYVRYEPDPAAGSL